MPIQLTFDEGANTGKKFKSNVKNFTAKHERALLKTARRVQAEIETEGRANIAAGGNFSSNRWQQGFRALLSYRAKGDIRIRATHAVKYWRVFEKGAIIYGRPLLWIPLSFGNAHGVRARDYPGNLFRVNRRGKAPLLMDASGPQYFGKESVRIPKKWSLRSTVRRISLRMSKYFKEAMKSNG
jgi:hypothetical protein